MRALVFSDSHGRVQPMLDAVELYRPDVIFHLGDVVRDGEKVRLAFPQTPFYQVRGNCDWDRADQETEGVARLAGKTVFYLHGHTQYVKSGLTHAVARARALGADLLLYGHTHRPQEDDCGGLLAVNPGAIQDGLCALLTWTEDTPIHRLPLYL